MASRKFYCVLGAAPESALVESFRSLVTAPAEFLDFRRDDALDVELHFLEENPAADREPSLPLKYVDPTGWTVKVGVGTIDAVPTGGTFTLTDSAASQTTSGIAYDASAATIQTRIRADLSTNFSSATVSGSAGGPWTIDRVTTGAFATNPTGSSAALTPSGSKVVVINTEDGTSSLSEKWQLSLSRALPIYKESGWSALASASVNVATTQSGSATRNAIYRVTFNADAYGGSVTLNFTNGTDAGSVTFAYNATAEEVQTAFQGHRAWVSDALDGVTVQKNASGDYTIECTGTDIDLGATTALATETNSLKVPVGFSARLACNTALVNTLLAGASSAEAVFEIEITRTGSSAETIVHRTDATIYADLIRNAAGSSSATQVFPTNDQVVNWSSTLTGYTGGGSTNLDGLVTANTLSAGYYIKFCHSTDGPVAFQLTSATTAESSPDVIRPDDYASSTNEKVWLKRE